MDVKRLLVFGMLGLFMISMMSGVLGADLSGEAAEVGEAVATGIGGFLEPLLSPFFGDQEILSRIFFALLLGMIIFSIISVMFTGSSKVMQWGITGAITALSLLGMPANFLEAIRTSYGAMGATILVMIPFIIILVFSLRTRSLLMARMTWIVYSIYYFVMYLYQISTETGWLTTESVPYMVGVAIGVIVFFFMPAIRNLIIKGEIEGIRETGEKGIGEAKLLKELKTKELKEVYG